MTRSQAPLLTRRDWVLAGLAALAEGGVEAVKVDRLAKVLDVTRGSFYWHFADRSDLLESLLDLWESELTQQIIVNAAALPAPRERLLAVARESLDRVAHGVDVARAEGALRFWASHDAAAGNRMRRVDAARVTYLAAELEKSGIAPATCTALAKGLYLALLGLYAARAYNPALADDDAFMQMVAIVLETAEPVEAAAS